MTAAGWPLPEDARWLVYVTERDVLVNPIPLPAQIAEGYARRAIAAGRCTLVFLFDREPPPAGELVERMKDGRGITSCPDVVLLVAPDHLVPVEPRPGGGA